MFNIKCLEETDKTFWYTLDKHLPEAEFIKKFVDKRGYIILDDEKPVVDSMVLILAFYLEYKNCCFK